jgi:hypothetical protein
VRRALAVLLPVLACTGCLGLRRADPPPTEGALVLPGVPRFAFGTDRCGSGALASVFSYYGDPETQESLDATLPKTESGGVLSVDLLLAARSRGYRVRLVDGTAHSLLAAVQQGIPPVLLLRLSNLPGRKRDLYHYVVVDGSDHAGQRVRVLLGDGQARWIATSRLERPWSGAGHALLLVSRPPPPSDRLGTAVALERAGRLTEAADAYRALAREAPSTVLWTNLGNVETSRDRLDAAEDAYGRALALDPEEPEPLAGLAWLRFRQGRNAEAASLAERAARRPGPVAGLALDTVARARLALGECEGAAEAFRASLDALAPGNRTRPSVAEGLAAATACAASRPGS